MLKCLVHVNTSMAILYVYIPVTWIVAWHIFRGVARSVCVGNGIIYISSTTYLILKLIVRSA